MPTFDEILATVGYPAANAAHQLGSITRQRELGRSQIKLAGEEERGNIDAGWEDRGLLRSGERGLDQTRQQGREAQRIAQLEAAAADNIAGVDLDLMRAVTEENAGDTYQDGVDQMNREQLARALQFAQMDAADLMASVTGDDGWSIEDVLAQLNPDTKPKDGKPAKEPASWTPWSSW